ncbi:MAG: hypothetical protein ACI8X5_002734 [Planctomycetota bacterium]|jgi:hypothetical protein
MHSQLPLLLVACMAPVTLAQGPQDSFVSELAPLLERYCVDCHCAPEPEGGIDLEPFTDTASALGNAKIWQRVRKVMASGSMPPEDIRSRPKSDEIHALTQWIDEQIARGLLPAKEDPVGHTTIRRLNRSEYRHAILDLLGVDYPTPELLPADGIAHGYDVIGKVLSMPPIVFEKYFEAAEQIASGAVPHSGEEVYREQQFLPLDFELSDKDFSVGSGNFVRMHTSGSASVRFDIDKSGEYVLHILAGGQQAGPDPTRMDVAIDEERIARIDVTALAQDPKEYELHLRVLSGERKLSLSFVNDYYDPDNPDPGQRDRNFFFAWAKLAGPVDEPILSPFQSEFMSGESDAQRVLERFAKLAWRSEVSPKSVRALFDIAGETAEPAERIRTALTAILASPRFLFRSEPEPEQGSRVLDSYELATRMAAFLWSSVPDAKLLELASTGELRMPSVVDAQVDLMLRDARSSRLATNFANQWLQLRRLDNVSPNLALYPEFDEELRSAMKSESELFFDAILREDRRVSELLGADFTFVNERLALHYGLVGVYGSAMRRVALPKQMSAQRCGILGQAAVLTATSNPTRTSPVLRGKWILESLFATPPAPPPPGVGSLDESHEITRATSIRERLEQHRTERACASCHAPMDGFGFALENFGPTGAWRERDGGFAIDATAEMPGNVKFEGPAGLRDRLLSDQDFLRGFLRHLATYALGRGLVERDEAALLQIMSQLPYDPTVRQVIHSVVNMEAFRKRFREETE